MVIFDFNSPDIKPIKKTRFKRYSFKKVRKLFPHLNRNDMDLLPSLRVYGKLDKASAWLLLQNPLVHSKYKRYITLLLYGLIFIITHRARSVKLVSNFFTDNVKFYRGFKANDFQPYYANLAEFPMSDKFVFPNEFGLFPTRLHLGTRTKKKLNRIKYRDSIYYNEWKAFQRVRINSFYRFSTFKKPYLDKIRKRWEDTITDFNPLLFTPTSLHDALCYFFIYGPPPKNCKDRKKIRMFFIVFFSGLYFDRKYGHSVCNMFFERRLFLSQFQEEEIASSSNSIGELKFVFPNESDFKLKSRIWFRKAQLISSKFVGAFSKLFISNFHKISDRLYLFFGYWSRYLSEQFGYFSELVLLVWKEVTPFFVPNPISFMWRLIPYKVEYYGALLYVFSVETFYEGRQFFYIEDEVNETHSVAPGLSTEMAEYYLFTQWVDLWYDYIVYYTYRIFNPIKQLFLEFPIWTFLNYVMAVWAHGGTLLNNTWYSVLTYRNTETKVKGRWYKIPLILIRWAFHWVFFAVFIIFFVFYIDYRDVAYYLEFVMPFSALLHSVHTTYIAAVFIAAFRFFGPYSLQELMRVDAAWDFWFCVFYTNLIHVLDLDPYAIPNAAWNSPAVEIGLNEDQLIVFSHDKPAMVIYGREVEIAMQEALIEPGDYRVHTFIHDFDEPLYGEDSKMVEVMRTRGL